MTVDLAKLDVGPQYVDWTPVDCGCCAGMAWGDPMRECDRCDGSAGLWLTPSGTRLALYPGGPFVGVASESDRQQARANRLGRVPWEEPADG